MVTMLSELNYTSRTYSTVHVIRRFSFEENVWRLKNPSYKRITNQWIKTCRHPNLQVFLVFTGLLADQTIHCTECPKIYRKSVLQLSKYRFAVNFRTISIYFRVYNPDRVTLSLFISIPCLHCVLGGSIHTLYNIQCIYHRVYNTDRLTLSFQ